MSKGEVLVSKLLPVDTLAACTIATGEVATLDHELGNYPMEHTPAEMQRLA